MKPECYISMTGSPSPNFKPLDIIKELADESCINLRKGDKKPISFSKYKESVFGGSVIQLREIEQIDNSCDMSLYDALYQWGD